MNIYKNKKRIKASTKIRRTVIKASEASVQDMLDAFEEKLAEFDVQSKTNVSCSTGTKDVIIDDSDYDVYYIDNGGFGQPGEVYSLGEIKLMWNNDCDSDPICSQYASFDEWFADTKANYLEEYYV